MAVTGSKGDATLLHYETEVGIVTVLHGENANTLKPTKFQGKKMYSFKVGKMKDVQKVVHSAYDIWAWQCMHRELTKVTTKKTER